MSRTIFFGFIAIKIRFYEHFVCSNFYRFIQFLAFFHTEKLLRIENNDLFKNQLDNIFDLYRCWVNILDYPKKIIS